MNRNLPLGAIIAQKKMRSSPELKKLFFETLAHLATLNSDLRIKYIREKIDTELQRIELEKITCRNGCAHCCHHLINLSEAEALTLPLLSDNSKIDKQNQALHSWQNLNYQERRCVYLGENNSCQVYADRPLICRTTLVTSSSELCDLDQNGEIEPYYVDRAYLYLLAYYSLEESAPLPQILKKLKHVRA